MPASLRRWKSPPPSPALREFPATAPARATRCSPGSLISGSRSLGPANSSSLLFSCTRIKSFANLPFDRLAERIFAFFMEGHAFHRNLVHLAVIQLIALAQEISPLRRVRYYGNHSIR